MGSSNIDEVFTTPYKDDIDKLFSFEKHSVKDRFQFLQVSNMSYMTQLPIHFGPIGRIPNHIWALLLFFTLTETVWSME